MIRILFILIFLIYSRPFIQIATAQTELPQSFKNLHVTLPDGCKLYESPINTPHDPYTQTAKCTGGDFAGVTRVQAKVERIVDGDTIHVYIGNSLYSVRMLGMDTPELHFLAKAQPYWGQKAKESMESLVHPGDQVDVEFDQIKCDRYGRILVHVWSNGVNLNEQQIKRGMAVNYCIAPNLKHCAQFATDYRRAEASRLGIHGDKCLITPYVWRRGMENSLMDKKVKNTVTGAQFAPGDYYKVPVGDRLFFPSTIY